MPLVWFDMVSILDLNKNTNLHLTSHHLVMRGWRLRVRGLLASWMCWRWWTHCGVLKDKYSNKNNRKTNTNTSVYKLLVEKLTSDYNYHLCFILLLLQNDNWDLEPFLPEEGHSTFFINVDWYKIPYLRDSRMGLLVATLVDLFKVIIINTAI